MSRTPLSRPALAQPLAAVGLIACIIGPVLHASPVEPSGESRWRWLTLAVAVVSLVGCAVWARYKGTEALARTGGAEPLGALLLAIGVVGAAYYLLQAIDRGFISTGTAISGLGALLVAAALVVRPFPWDIAELRPHLRLAAGVAAGASVALAATALVGRINGTGVTTYADPTPPAPVPTSVSKQAWSWTAPARLAAPPEPAGNGFVAATKKAVYLVDGVTGKPRWRYQRDHVQVRDIDVTPGGRLVVVDTYINDGDHDGPLIVLDALTGKQHAALPHDAAETFTGSAAVSGSKNDLTATPLTDRGQAWSHRAPSGCRFGDTAASESTFTVRTRCGVGTSVTTPRDELIAYDDRSGSVLWHHPVGDKGRAKTVLSTGTAGEGCNLTELTTYLPPSTTTQSQSRLLDARTGKTRITGKPDESFGACRDGWVQVFGQAFRTTGWINLATGARGGARTADAGPLVLRDQSLGVTLGPDASTASVTPHDLTNHAGTAFTVETGPSLKEGAHTRNVAVPGAVVIVTEGSPVQPGTPPTIIGLR
ncbi:PQQ-binding-like beta-propeller repeat protein [Luteipulveratus mongoliensis]|uniref:Pyrrolo-quinoline quinone repeat domain-containing protein n=1 Tax=Luteipulveratus mongoliensis TaxID=571913 RepID=A0A0K1JPA6_9MICO|nr:PQQ-binding-like beta-propeller repeat protein [Luteipulveratus mongoliensis]AKU18418.1 hypothetical protein VV02_25485 [Luteipulveratus mongoliensis]